MVQMNYFNLHGQKTFVADSKVFKKISSRGAARLRHRLHVNAVAEAEQGEMQVPANTKVKKLSDNEMATGRDLIFGALLGRLSQSAIRE